MRDPNRNTRPRISFRAIVLSLTVIFLQSVPPVRAQNSSLQRDRSAANLTSPIIHFEPANDDSADRDGDSLGGASRPATQKCQQDTAYPLPMTPLLPDSSRGLTVATHPTFFVYIPPTSAPKAYFIIKDTTNDLEVYQTMLPLTQTAGVIGIELPDSAPPLEVGKTYRWFVGLLCQPSQTDLPIVEGNIERIELDSELTVNASLEEQAVSYGASGIWYDTIERVVQLRQQQPDNEMLSRTWWELLDSVGLAEIAIQPML
ncbi:DUF928 domain-containing protein [Oscillatoriales cyanobacterium LEGE 11467]|uniref:DUF928 domain-containing protein n=1 Tax=Zarconia navalis LEGE 11467 TaxID=1828826 RepID=A0A928W2I0_9CYAN|nr:DUF928 domain-containing protein [Zarconia navalis]MBE9042050.1 DUF928 domain-containing protein [Zarconia navalis LEGE 11467]